MLILTSAPATRKTGLVQRVQFIEQGAALPTLTTFTRLHRVLKFDLRRALRLIP
jgi:hypothetical protein